MEINVLEERARKLERLAERYGISQEQVIDLLLDLHETTVYKDKNGKIKETMSGRSKVERQIKIWLHSKVDFQITASKLRKFTQVDLNSCKDMVSAYQNRIDEHNARLKKIITWK